jgi:hypothetical protein
MRSSRSARARTDAARGARSSVVDSIFKQPFLFYPRRGRVDASVSERSGGGVPTRGNTPPRASRDPPLSGEGSSKRQRPYSLRPRVRRRFSFVSLEKSRGWSTERRVLLMCAHRCQCAAPLGAPSRRLTGSGPRFPRRPTWPRRSASSSQGTLVCPGGVRPRPGAGLRAPRAGAASRSAFKTSLEDAPR